MSEALEQNDNPSPPEEDKIIRLHRPPEQHELRNASHTPWIAFAALVGAALTVFLILALLLAINDQPTWPSGGIYGLVQPASVLSLLLSLSDFLLAYSFAAGFEITWSYQANKPDASVAKLQDYYAAGSSKFDAVRLSRRCFYLSLAVVVCSLTPILGFVFQGAITTKLDVQVTPINMTIPIVRTLDVGFSTRNATGDYWESGWNRIWQQVLNIGGSQFTQYAYFGTFSNFNNMIFDFGYDNTSVYSTTVIGAGFAPNCSEPVITYDLLPTRNRSLSTGLIFLSSVSWSQDRPNEINVNVLWKTGSACSGIYQTRNCTLRAAHMEYPIQIQMKVTGTPYRGPFFSLKRLSPSQISDKVISIIPVAPNEGVNDTWTYRGIAQSLGMTFNSTMTTFDSYYHPGYGQLGSTGSFGPSIQPSYLNTSVQPPSQEGIFVNSSTPSAYYCNLSFDGGLHDIAYYQLIDSNIVNPAVEHGLIPTNVSADPAQIIIERLRQAMFLASIYEGSRKYTNSWNYNSSAQHNFNGSRPSNHFSNSSSPGNGNHSNSNPNATLPYPSEHYFQTIPSSRSTTRVLYSVRIYLWGIALAISWSIIILVVPLFWGKLSFPAMVPNPSSP